MRPPRRRRRRMRSRQLRSPSRPMGRHRRTRAISTMTIATSGDASNGAGSSNGNGAIHVVTPADPPVDESTAAISIDDEDCDCAPDARRARRGDGSRTCPGRGPAPVASVRRRHPRARTSSSKFALASIRPSSGPSRSCSSRRTGRSARRSSPWWIRSSLEGGFAVTRDERSRLVEEMIHDVTGFGPIEPLPGRSDHHRGHGQRAEPHLHRARRQDPARRLGLPERPARPARHRADHHPARPADRRIEPAGRCPPARRLARQRDHRAALAHRTRDHRPQVLARRRTRSRTSSASGRRRPRCSSSCAPASRRDSTSSSRAARARARRRRSTSSRRSSPNDERIVTIEDAAELQLRQDHVITLEARPPNLEGEGEITIRNLLRNAMHMRPDRIIVGECRAGEALDMLQAMTTGHDGSLSTGHANSPEGHAPAPRDDGPDDRLRRCRCARSASRSPRPSTSSSTRPASRTAQRKIVNITEVYGIEDDEILTQDIFAFVQTGYQRRQDRGRRSSRPASGRRS